MKFIARVMMDLFMCACGGKPPRAELTRLFPIADYANRPRPVLAAAGSAPADQSGEYEEGGETGNAGAGELRASCSLFVGHILALVRVPWVREARRPERRVYNLCLWMDCEIAMDVCMSVFRAYITL